MQHLAKREETIYGYTEAILSLSSTTQRLAKWEETIYGMTRSRWMV